MGVVEHTVTNNGQPYLYKGEALKSNKRAFGKGTAIYMDGSSYEGTWNDNRREGFGVFTNEWGNRWEGEWLDDRKHGKCTRYEKTGTPAKIYNELNHNMAKSMTGNDSILVREITEVPEIAFFENGLPKEIATREGWKAHV